MKLFKLGNVEQSENLEKCFSNSVLSSKHELQNKKKNYNPSYMDENNQYQLNLERTLEVPYNYKGEKEYESTDIESKVLKVRRLV